MSVWRRPGDARWCSGLPRHISAGIDWSIEMIYIKQSGMRRNDSTSLVFILAAFAASHHRNCRANRSAPSPPRSATRMGPG
jgi:hypothetical protein